MFFTRDIIGIVEWRAPDDGHTSSVIKNQKWFLQILHTGSKTGIHIFFLIHITSSYANSISLDGPCSVDKACLLRIRSIICGFPNEYHQASFYQNSRERIFPSESMSYTSKHFQLHQLLHATYRLNQTLFYLLSWNHSPRILSNKTFSSESVLLDSVKYESLLNIVKKS